MPLFEYAKIFVIELKGSDTLYLVLFNSLIEGTGGGDNLQVPEATISECNAPQLPSQGGAIVFWQSHHTHKNQEQ